MTHLTIKQPESENDIATLFTDDGVIPRIGEVIRLDGHQYRVSDVQYLLTKQDNSLLKSASTKLINAFLTSVSTKLINVKILTELIN